MNIFLVELKAHRKSLILWCFGMLFMTFAGMSKFSAFDSSGQNMNEMLDTFPRALRTMLGLGDFDLSKAIGFYGVLYLYLIVMATIHAAMLGANIIAKEERDKTAEFLFTKPITRQNIITGKLLAALVNIIILNLFTLIISIIVVSSFGTTGDDIVSIILLMFSMLILQLLFASIGATIAAFIKTPKLAATISTGILMATFLLSIIINMTEKLDFLIFLTPFKYFEAKNMIGPERLELSFIRSDAFQVFYVILSLIIITICIYFTYLFYKKRDLTI